MSNLNFTSSKRPRVAMVSYNPVHQDGENTFIEMIDTRRELLIVLEWLREQNEVIKEHKDVLADVFSSERNYNTENWWIQYDGQQYNETELRKPRVVGNCNGHGKNPKVYYSNSDEIPTCSNTNPCNIIVGNDQNQTNNLLDECPRNIIPENDEFSNMISRTCIPVNKLSQEEAPGNHSPNKEHAENLNQIEGISCIHQTHNEHNNDTWITSPLSNEGSNTSPQNNGPWVGDIANNEYSNRNSQNDCSWMQSDSSNNSFNVCLLNDGPLKNGSSSNEPSNDRPPNDKSFINGTRNNDSYEDSQGSRIHTTWSNGTNNSRPRNKRRRYNNRSRNHPWNYFPQNYPQNFNVTGNPGEFEIHGHGRHDLGTQNHDELRYDGELNYGGPNNMYWNHGQNYSTYRYNPKKRRVKY